MALGHRRGLSLLLIAVFLAACAADGPPPNPIAEKTSASELASPEKREVDDFFAIMSLCGDVLAHSPFSDKFLDTVLSNLSLDIEPPFDERATLVVSLGPDGYIDDLELMSVTSPAIEAPFRVLVEAPPSFSRAPLDVRTCVGTERFPILIKVFQHYQCFAQEEYFEYLHDVESILYKVLYSPRYSSTPGHGWVKVSATLGSEGQIQELNFPSQSNPLANAKLNAAIRGAGSFPLPPDFSRCFAQKPLLLRIQVQGE